MARNFGPAHPGQGKYRQKRHRTGNTHQKNRGYLMGADGKKKMVPVKKRKGITSK